MKNNEILACDKNELEDREQEERTEFAANPAGADQKDFR